MTPEILARLTPGSLDPSRIQYSGGIPEHTSGEIAGALAHCSEGARLYASVFYCGADEYRGRLMSEIRLNLAGVAAQKGWEIRKPGTLEGMAWLAMAEESAESSRCPTCGGIKYKTIRGRVVECGPCGGTGRRQYEHPHRFIGLNRANWHRVWKPRYEQYVRPLLSEWRWEVRKALLVELRVDIAT